MPTAHLICGATGAGKTTYARALAERTGAVRFSIDEWMAPLFWVDAPPRADYAWALERVERCERVVLTVCGQLFGLGQDAVLDLGFFGRQQRGRIAQSVTELGARPQLHYLDVPAEERWRRVAGRNEQRGDTYALPVSRQVFDFAEGLFETPGEDELAGAVLGD